MLCGLAAVSDAVDDVGDLSGHNVAFAARYALLDHWTAAAMNGVMAAQTLAAIWIVRSPQLRWIYYALIPLLAALSLATWHGLPSFLAAMATTFSTIGRMQGNEPVMRVLLLASTPFWAAHDLAVGSLPGLIADFHGNRHDQAVPAMPRDWCRRGVCYQHRSSRDIQSPVVEQIAMNTTTVAPLMQ